MELSLIILVFLTGIAIGGAIGYIGFDTICASTASGKLRIDTSADEPYVFLELYENEERFVHGKYVTLIVDRTNINTRK